MNFTFFHRPRPRQFEYKPRFYNPEKDPDDSGEGLDQKEQFARRLHREWDSSRTTTTRRRTNPTSIIWLVLGIVLIIYFIHSKAFTTITNYFGGGNASSQNIAAVDSSAVINWDTDSTEILADTSAASAYAKQVMNEGGPVGGPFAEILEQKARKVIAGEYGDDRACRQALGDEYDLVMSKVEEIKSKAKQP